MQIGARTHTHIPIHSKRFICIVSALECADHAVQPSNYIQYNMKIFGAYVFVSSPEIETQFQWI